MPTNIAGLLGVTVIVFRPVSTPLPDRLTICGLVLALSVMVRLPVLVPSVVGVNVTEIVQLDPDASVFGERGQVVDDSAKSPEVEIAEIVSGVDWPFFRVIFVGLLVLPGCCPENVTLPGVTLTGSTPVPDKATDCGLFDALWVTVSVPLRVPAAIGANAMDTVQVVFAASVFGARGHVVVVTVKSPVAAMLAMVNGVV